MLFGCESNAIKPRGLVGEGSGPPYTFHAMKCPGSLGALSIVTDVCTDIITLAIISQWIPSNETMATLDIYDDSFTKERANEILSKYQGKQNPNLLNILTKIRGEMTMAVRMCTAFVFRGLPLYNKSIVN